MHNPITANLRKVADNLDGIADHEAVRGHAKLVHVLRNNAAYVRKAALTFLNTEIAMGRVANDLKQAEAQRDTARAERDAANADKARLQAQLDAQKVNLLDGEDLAALDKFEADQTPTPAPEPETPVTPETPA